MKDDGQKLTSFQIQLLSAIIDMNEYPFIRLVLEHHLNEKEFADLFALLERQNEAYLEQKEEGLLDYSSLLTEFAGLLNEKLEPNETIYALRKENYYPELMDEYIKVLNRSTRISRFSK